MPMRLSQVQRGTDLFARALGVFSIGLGAAECTAARRLSDTIGIETHPGLVRFLGIREIANGVGILAAPRRPQLLWSRVGGDAIDLTLMGIAFGSPRTRRLRLLTAIGAVAGVTALDVLCARLMSRKRYRHVESRWLTGRRGVRLQKSISINRSPDDLYRFCREFSNLPKILDNVESITEPIAGEYEWHVSGPRSKHFKWMTKIIEDRPNQLISWRTLHPASIENSGSIRFVAGQDGRGTIVRVELLHRPTKQGINSAIRMLSPRIEFRLSEALRRLKAFMETGEIPTTKGQTSGRPPGLLPVDQEVGEPLGLRALLAR